MSLGTFTPGEIKARPGRYVRLVGTGQSPAATPSGRVAVVAIATDGPLNTPTELTSEGQLTALFGAAGGTDVARQAFLGGVEVVQFVRPGSGGAAAELQLDDDDTPSATGVITLTWRHVGVNGNSAKATVRDDPADGSFGQLLIYLGTELLDTVSFAAGSDEVDGLVAALADNDYVSAVKDAAGTGTLARATDLAFTGGSAPTVNSASYTTAYAALNGTSFDVITIDSVTPSVHTALGAQLDSWAQIGKRVEGVVGEPKSVAIADRLTHAAANNNDLMRYVAMGWNDGDGDVEGAAAAGRIAGEIASQPKADTFVTGLVIAGALTLLESISPTQYETAVTSGAIMFRINAAGQIAVDAGVTTRVTLGEDEDSGVKKIRRMRIRMHMLDRVVSATESLTVRNDEDGQKALIGAAQYELNRLVSEGALAEAEAFIDPDNPPADDNVWIGVGFRDVDSADKVYFTFRLR